MEDEIKITANLDPAAPNACKFVVDRPVYPEGSVYFSSRDQAADSPLALKIFAIEGVQAIQMSGHGVKVVKEDDGDWRPMAVQIGGIIRLHLKSGEPAVAPDLRLRLMPDDEIRARIQEILDTQINPAVAAHGGFVDLIDVKNGTVYVQMGGGCQGCGMATATLRQGIEAEIRSQIPDVGEILDVTDHAEGTNPYYAPARS